ncbi:MAG TPA: hypothetical protein VHE55_15840 [Fimbriimonadaceae bacterium]|nr:hypothetical protein [Fimbriimonadaceae bacterium]
MKLARSTIFAILLFCSAVALAQKAAEIKRGSPDFKAIIQAIAPYASVHAAHPVRVAGNTMRREGDWAFVYSSLTPVNPKDKVDGKVMAVLRKGRRWTIREIIVAGGSLDATLADWVKKHKLPAELTKKPWSP